jgi:hypothetical protein
MEQIHKLITKYGLILAFSAMFGHLWFYTSGLLFPMNRYNYHAFWRDIPNYIVSLTQLLICVLLFIDSRKYQIKFWLIPIIGLFYPLVGVSAFLILYIYKREIV